MIIKHLTHNLIDKEKWDEGINQADNGLVYALSWYLDIVSPKWEALVTEDFKYLMPVPIKRKYKIPYLVQPSLSQQLGIFSSEPITKEIILLFIKKLPSYSYQLSLNFSIKLSLSVQCPNYILSLNKPYEEIIKNFSKNTIRNIEKANKNKLKTIYNIQSENFITFYEEHKKIKYNCLEELITHGIAHKIINLVGALDDNNNLIAALAYTQFKNRITFLIPASNKEGREKSAMFCIIDDIIKISSGQEMILDFEGSSVEGIARFYKGFGAKNQPYYVIKRFRPSFLIGRI